MKCKIVFHQDSLKWRQIVAQQIAEQKCKEYAKFVYQSEQSPTMHVQIDANHVSKCGIVETPLIVGGFKAKLAEFPHMALIGYGSPQVNGWHCGGSIISENVILSAAHCIKHPDGEASVVRIGLLNKRDHRSMQEIKISQIIQHPQYQSNVKYHDIVLFKLVSNIKFEANIRPACLNTNPNLVWDRAVVIGFGQLASDGPVSDHLMKSYILRT
uniref:CSON006259 protein n=1 Tax=Culicoides sonorensis TaxID=179676 RepID=A0A336MY88_CULSO